MSYPVSPTDGVENDVAFCIPETLPEVAACNAAKKAAGFTAATAELTTDMDVPGGNEIWYVTSTCGSAESCLASASASDNRRPPVAQDPPWAQLVDTEVAPEVESFIAVPHEAQKLLDGLVAAATLAHVPNTTEFVVVAT